MSSFGYVIISSDIIPIVKKKCYSLLTIYNVWRSISLFLFPTTDLNNIYKTYQILPNLVIMYKVYILYIIVFLLHLFFIYNFKLNL